MIHTFAPLRLQNFQLIFAVLFSKLNFHRFFSIVELLFNQCCPKLTSFDYFHGISAIFAEKINISLFLKFPEIMQRKLLHFSESDFRKFRTQLEKSQTFKKNRSNLELEYTQLRAVKHGPRGRGVAGNDARELAELALHLEVQPAVGPGLRFFQLLIHFNSWRILGKLLRGSFSAVSKPDFASRYSFENS